MSIPVWVAYSLITAVCVLSVALSIAIVTYFGGILVNIVIPNLWTVRQRYRVRNMSKEKFEAYLYSLRHEWTEHHIKKNQNKEE